MIGRVGGSGDDGGSNFHYYYSASVELLVDAIIDASFSSLWTQHY